MHPRSVRSGLDRLRRTFGAGLCVRETARFARRELRGRGSAQVYRLRKSELRTVIRHPLLDMWVLEELFRGGSYTFPPSVTEAVRGLGRPPAIVDLGGHVGLFGLLALGHFPRARISSFEPDPDNAAILHRCVEANGLHNSWEVVEAAAAVKDGPVEFLSDFHLSRLGRDAQGVAPEHASIRQVFPFLDGSDLLSVKKRTVEGRDIFPRLRDCDLLKVDIQGGEWDLLLDGRLPEIGATALVLEIHPDACPVPDAAALVHERLEAAGYRLEPMSSAHDREWMVWAVRTRPAASPGSTPA